MYEIKKRHFEMIDLIITNNQLNMKKIVIIIVVLILTITISTIAGIELANKHLSEKYIEELDSQIAKVEEENRIKKEEEEKKKQEEIQKRIELTSTTLTEEQQYNILHIYNSTGEKRVFLTFDDGPTSLITPLILDVLKMEDVKATFFLLGTNAKYNQDLIKREFEEGHYIANHGYSHIYSEIYASPEATLAEYNATEQIIRDALGNQNYRSNLFRFPGGSNGGKYDVQKQLSKAYLRENGIIHLDWNALNEDAAGSYTKEQLLENAINTIGNKDSVVILMHDSSDKILTYEMLPDLIHYLKEQGYSFKNIYDIL